MSIIKKRKLKGQMGDLKGQNKGQKLASAVYLITSFFNEHEPLKWRLRSLSLDLATESVKDKFNIAREIISLLSLSKVSGLISDTNYSIVAKQFSGFIEESEKYFDLRDFLDSGKEEEALPLNYGQNLIKDKNIEKVEKERGLSYLPKVSALKSAPSKPLKDFGAVSVKKNTRQNVIISLLKRKREIMIKDVATLISDCSEKTIQRELLSMVASGVLKKIGEKRWSRYSLA